MGLVSLRDERNFEMRCPMYQLHFDSSTESEMRGFIESIKERLEGANGLQAVFHMFNCAAEEELSTSFSNAMRDILPGALFAGCSTDHNIKDGSVVNPKKAKVTIACDVYEEPSTRIELFQFPLDQQHWKSTAEQLLKLVEERPWVKAVELISTGADVRMVEFCEEISNLPESVDVFGGVALTSESVNMIAGLPHVFSSAGDITRRGIVFILYGGESFYTSTQTVVGWKPLGRSLEITRADGPILYELDGKPAFSRYKHYLGLDDEHDFEESSLIFPFVIDHKGALVVRAPASAGEDGSITLTGYLTNSDKYCRICYGDPATILHSVKECASELYSFSPQAILSYSCAARLMYWDARHVSCETLPFNNLAPTAGFYTGGEFSRLNGAVLHHNVTLVVVGIREGAANQTKPQKKLSKPVLTRQMAVVRSLATFIGVTSEELQDAYEQMEILAKTDGLTGICNRHEIEALISEAIADDGPRPSVIMLDIDNFKVVNDAYGHKAGDDVLRGLGSLMQEIADRVPDGSAGRWGGEEFMMLLPSSTLDEAAEVAEQLRERFAEIDFPSSGRHTLSVGVAQALEDETIDLLCQRADKALYAAKKNGKNCVIVA